MLEIKHIKVYYNDVVALDDISLSVADQAITGIIGPNGAGKSTLLKSILNIIPHQGEALINGKNSKESLRDIAYVEQKTDIDSTFPIKVRECVSLGTYAQMKIFQKTTRKEWEKVTAALEKVNLADYAERQIGELSGGQFQRVLLARCLAQEADYIFLDEPFVGIDSVSEKIIMDALLDLKAQGKTILIVHHDLSKVRQYFDQLIILNQRLIANGPVDAVFDETNLKAAYGDSIFV
ncbi:metal ABC transporter ATP-binding protein [Xylocopilactobacillus apicola]|uniref:Manganese ABC transporter ATP-binding protein n=1 Tax=Xylocopilactobacillus apicola TaxID=2932184 RepID=A0AAU9D029_9LACO|nr:metal ABC transporter ATP-binding protein [Xylocopilactobacillus apicola]BDR59632.1 manganese ABC transporter ATP-binding protein [Xylocopilactobacillus apicola]